MPVVNKIQNSFSSGELDSKLRARNDIATYYTGAAKMRNVLATPQGGAKRRPGLEYVTALGSANVKTFSFEYSGDTTYLMVLSEDLMTIYKRGVVVDTVACTVSADQVPDVTFTASNDTVLVFHQEFAPKYFLRASDTSWSTGTWTIINTPTYAFDAAITTGLQIKDQADAVIDFSTVWVNGDKITGAKFYAGATPFVAGDVGRYIRSYDGGYALITSFVNTGEVGCTILAPFTNDITTGQTNYASGEWYIEDEVWSASKGYPACGAFFQGRLWMASTTDLPYGVWASKSLDENDFTNWTPSFADNGIFVISRDAQTSFHNMHAGRHLTLFTDNAMLFVNGGTNNEPITPLNITINMSTGAPGADSAMAPLGINNAVVYMRNGGKSVMEATYDLGSGGYVAADLNLLASHVLNSPVDMAYRRQTNTDEADYVIVINSDGTASILCTLREQEITAWTICETDGLFKRVAVADSEIYFIIQRTVDSAPRFFLEKFNDDLLLDCAILNPEITLTYSGTTLTYDAVTLTYTDDGVETIDVAHLNNETIKVIVDNTILSDETVTGGQITIDSSGTDVQVGLDFPEVDSTTGAQTYIESMPVEIDMGGGQTTVGMKKRLSEVTVMLYETSHININSNRASIRRIGVDALDSSVPKRTENLKISGILGWDDEVSIKAFQTLPLPMTLLGMAYKIRA